MTGLLWPKISGRQSGVGSPHFEEDLQPVCDFGSKLVERLDSPEKPGHFVTVSVHVSPLHPATKRQRTLESSVPAAFGRS
ncbi:MAG TPA: hypothetical protein VFV91_04970 [Gaiellaceae bacterium]|nr:hypothetical protein [Gaiellaceae bacterium]